MNNSSAIWAEVPFIVTLLRPKIDDSSVTQSVRNLHTAEILVASSEQLAQFSLCNAEEEEEEEEQEAFLCCEKSYCCGGTTGAVKSESKSIRNCCKTTAGFLHSGPVSFGTRKEVGEN